MDKKIDCDRCKNGRIIDKRFNIERAEKLLKQYNKNNQLLGEYGSEAQRIAWAQTVKYYMAKGDIPEENLDIDNSYTCPVAHVCKNVFHIGENK